MGTSWTVAFQGPVSLVFPSKTTGVGCHFSLRVNFSIRGSDPHYPHWQANFLPLSCQGNPSIGNTAVKKQTKNEISFSRQTVHVIISKLSCQCDFPDSASDKESACQCRRHETWVRSPGWEEPLEEEMATHSNILAWKIPWTEEPGGLQSMGSQRVRLD